MVIALAGGAVVTALSLLLGFATRRLVTRPAGARAIGTPTDRAATDRTATDRTPTGGEAETGLPQRWPALAARLLRPDRMAVAIAVWLALLDVVLSLAAPWPLKVVVDYALGHQPFPSWLAPLSGLHPVSVAVLAAMAGLLLLAASALTSYLVTVLGTAIGERLTVRLLRQEARTLLQGA